MLQKHAYMYLYFFFFLLLFTQGSISIYLTPCLAKQRVREEKERERRALFLSGAWLAKEKGNEKKYSHGFPYLLPHFLPISEERQMWANGKQIPTFFFPSNYFSNQTKVLSYPPCILPPFLAFPSIFPQTKHSINHLHNQTSPYSTRSNAVPPPHPKKNKPNIYTHTKGINSY